MLVPIGGDLRDKTWCLELRMGWKGAIGGARRPLAWRWLGSTVWKERVTGAGWSKADPGIVVTSDEGGEGALWLSGTWSPTPIGAWRTVGTPSSPWLATQMTQTWWPLGASWVWSCW